MSASEKSQLQEEKSETRQNQTEIIPACTKLFTTPTSRYEDISQRQ